MTTHEHRTHVSLAEVATARPSGYLQQLCKHFQHKLPASFDAARGRIEFAAGVCELDAEPGANRLRLRVSAGSADDLAQVEDVMARHFERFAFREALVITWFPAV